jgi:GTPase SAR1 family protein
MEQTTALHLVETAIEAAAAYDRADLARRLEAAAARLRDPSYRVMVVGEYKQGKSSLVNAMLNAPVCPVDDDIATAVPTVVRHATEPWGRVTYRREPGEPGSIAEVPIDRLATLVTDPGEPDLVLAEIGLPRRLLEGGLTLIDTPGVGGLGSAHTAATVAALPEADALVFVSDASQEYTRAEIEFLELAREACGEIVFVLAKTDLYPEWRRIKDIDERHLDRLGIDAELIPTSATLRLAALRADDRALNAESGYPHLVESLGARVGNAGAARLVAAATATVLDVVAQLDAGFAAEEEVLTDPSRLRALTEQFERAKQEAEALRGGAARWQITLNDGVSDLGGDLDHRLRARMRTVVKEGEDTIDGHDPADHWDRFEVELRARVAHDVAATYLDLARRAGELSEQVAAHFDSAVMRPELDTAAVPERVAAMSVRSRVEDNEHGVVGTGLTAMRGSYGGLLMFGMLGQMAGLTLLNPATAVLGILMGGKAVRDEKERQLTIRRQQAKASLRQFVDDVVFEVGKDVRDELKRAQRGLRDHYTGCADELNRSIAAMLAAAKTAAESGENERRQRLRDVQAERARLTALRTRAEQP